MRYRQGIFDIEVKFREKLPLEDETLDVGVFSLSLMGTNYADYLKEAFRVLKQRFEHFKMKLNGRGILKIAEVTSRIENLGKFKQTLHSIGFDVISQVIQVIALIHS
jgi:ribosomal RNA-processing protein 8